MSKKYNEIMNKVVVTDEMRSRVLREISSADPEKLAAYKIDADDDLAGAFSGRKRFPAAKILAGLAVACVLILIAGMIRVSQPLMSSPSMVSNSAYEEAEEFAAEAAEEDTVVGNQDAGGQSALQIGEDENRGTADAAKGGGTDNEASAEGSTSDRADTSVQLGEPEIRKIVEKYIGPDFEISNTEVSESTLVYTVSEVESGEIYSYIRIDVSDGSVVIEDVQTKEVSSLTFREMAGQ